jgi:hypothetical protein
MGASVGEVLATIGSAVKQHDQQKREEGRRRREEKVGIGVFAVWATGFVVGVVDNDNAGWVIWDHG